MPKAEDFWPDFPVILGYGQTHEMRDAEDRTKRSRLWDLKSPSKAACSACDTTAKPRRPRKAGFR